MYGLFAPTIRNVIIVIKVENVIKRSTVVLGRFREFDNGKQKCNFCICNYTINYNIQLYYTNNYFCNLCICNLHTIVHLQKKAFKCNFQKVTSHCDIKLKLLKQTIKKYRFEI